MNVSSRRGSGGRRVVSGAGGWSGTSYDVMSYQEAARSGQIQVRHREYLNTIFGIRNAILHLFVMFELV